MKGWIIIALALLLVVLLIVLLRTTSGLTSGASTCTACPITTSQYYTAASGCGIANCPTGSYTTGDTNSVGVSSCISTPTSSLIASGTALQVSEIDLGAISVPATNKPTLTIGPVTTGFSLSMWVKLPATVTPGVWWTLFGMDGHYVTLMPDTGTPTLWEIVFSTTGTAGINWSYMYRLTPGTYYRLGFVVSPPSAPTFYLDGGSGMTGSNMIGTGAVSHGSTGSDARFNPNNSPLTGIKVKNAYYFGKSLTASEMALLGASGMGSGTTSGYMPEPFTAEKDFAGY